jgi:adenylate kinase
MALRYYNPMLHRCIVLTLLCTAGFAQDKIAVLIIGPPGAGKTTQAKRISRKYHVPSVSMSDLLKKDAGWGKAGSKKVLKGQMESGELVNDETADLLVRKRLFLKDAEHGFVLDGYPANAAQADKLSVMLKERHLPQPVVIYLDTPDDAVRERMKRRRRADDTSETIERRLQQYHDDAKFLLERYPGAQLKKIDGARSEDQVWHDVEQALSAK